MKKFFAAVCCTLLVASASFAQSGSRVAPAAQAVQAASDAASAVTQGTPMAAPVQAAPMASSAVQGTVDAPMASSMAPMSSTMAPMTSTMAPMQQGCGCGGGAVSAPMMTSAPMVTSAPIMSSPDMSQSVISAPMAAAPVSTDCGCGAPAPAPAPACCPQQQRRQPVRGFVSRLGSRRNSNACCCN